MRLDDGAIVNAHSIMESSRIGSGAVVGPFSRLRPGADVRAGAHIGNFVELKNSTIHEGAKANHLAYLGDAVVGRKSNIGAGTITCNYDGVAKHKTTIGEGVFIGSDSALVAPVRIGNGAYIAAGSVITENVPPNALAIARGRQTNKPGWAKKQRAAKPKPSGTKSRRSRRPRSKPKPRRSSKSRR
jgi:bifunctional UDP-N-acetylglucosamine pyrophosphorylase/glucosamine-1-phosphate N-acetyltransferase